MDVYTIDFHILFRIDENILNAANDPGLNQITAVRCHLYRYIRGINFKLTVIDDILGMQLRFKTEVLIIFYTKFCNMRLCHSA